jgi:hypothetical protein
MKYAVEMGLGAMIYIPSFIKIGSGFRNLLSGDTHRDTHTQTARRSNKSTLIFSE